MDRIKKRKKKANWLAICARLRFQIRPELEEATELKIAAKTTDRRLHTDDNTSNCCR